MEKHIAYEKLSKKEKRKIDSYRRKTWGSLNPVTRKPVNSKAYNRKKNQYWTDELHCSGRAKIATLRSERNDQSWSRRNRQQPGW